MNVVKVDGVFPRVRTARIAETREAGIIVLARQVPADSMWSQVETEFTQQAGVQPVRWCQAAAVERTSWEIRTRGQLDAKW